MKSITNKSTKTQGKNMKLKNNIKMYTKGVYFVIASSAIFMALGFTFLIFIFNSKDIYAAANGDYRTLTSGNWNATSTWEVFSGGSWIPASATPKSTDGAITILNTHTVTVTASVTVDELAVQSSGAISISSGKTLTIANGTGTDYVSDGALTIFGTLTNSGNSSMTLGGLAILKNGGVNTFNSNATLTINNGGRYRREDASMTIATGDMTVNSGGVYQHNMDGQNIPDANWNTGALCEITGITTTKPGTLNQSFYNFTWNTPNQSSVENLAGKLTNIANDLTFVSTGTGTVRFGQGENYNMVIGGSYYHQGGTVYASTKSQNCTIDITGDYVQTGGTFAGSDGSKDNGEASPTITINGNFSISSGTFDFNQHIANTGSKGITDLNLKGNFSQTGGTLTETATQNGHGNVFFAKTGTQTFSKTAGTISNTVNFTVNNNAVVDMGTSIFTGGGTFDVLSGGGLNIGSVDGITASSAFGNIQVTGTRTYSTSGNYTYNGAAAQVTGDGLPSIVKTLTINNSNHATLTNTVSVSNTLTFTLGNFITSADTLIVGTSTGTLGTVVRTSGQVVGLLKRWIGNSIASNILFPIGSANFYEGINFSYTAAPSGGAITSTYSATDPGTSGLNLIEAPDTISSIGFGLWTSTTGNGLSGGTFSVDITATALPSVADFTKLHLLRRVNAGSAWLLSGTHSAGTGSNAVPVIHRTTLTSHGQFGIGGSSANPLPIELIYFKAKLENSIVKLSWATASEINNDYFSVERSSDAIHFEEIVRQKGVRNSTFTLFYSDKDENPISGNNYYRLKQTDFDGNFTYSDIDVVSNKLGTENNSDIEILSVVPNPFDEGIKLNFSARIPVEVSLMLINSSGSVVAHDKIVSVIGYNNYEFENFSNLSSGIYYVTLICNNQKISRKIIKK